LDTYRGATWGAPIPYTDFEQVFSPEMRPSSTTPLSVWRWKVNRMPERVNPFLGRPDLALAWLMEANTDPRFSVELRQILMDTGATAATLPTGMILLEEVARQLSTGELHLSPEFSPLSPTAEEIFHLTPEVQITPGAFQKPVPPPQQTEEPTFPPYTSQQLAAQCLEKASEDGSAFCAECQPDQ